MARIGDGSLGFSIISGPEWERVVRALGRFDDEAPHRFRNRIKEEADKKADIVKGRAERLPTPRHAGHTGLRKRVAAGVHVINRGEGGVRVITSMPTASEGIIPRGLDRLKGWRHPLFGDKNRWYSNPGYDWFMSTFSHSKDDFQRKLMDELEQGAQRIADAGGNNL